MFNTEDFPSSFLSRGLKFKVVGKPKPSEQKNSFATEKFSLGIGLARVPPRPAACASSSVETSHPKLKKPPAPAGHLGEPLPRLRRGHGLDRLLRVFCVRTLPFFGQSRSAVLCDAATRRLFGGQNP